VDTHWDPEETETTDDSPTLLQPTIVCKKGVGFVQVSMELFEDSDIAQQVGRVLADAKAVEEGLAFTITQSNGPTGIITALVAAGGSTVIATGTNVLAQGDLYANQAALPARWQPNAKWMMSLPILNGYRQLPQATGLNYSIVNDATNPPTILGWPVYVNSSMDSTLTGAAADYLVLSGAFENFAIVDRLATTVELVPHIFGATGRRPIGSRGFYMHWRTGSGALHRRRVPPKQFLDLMPARLKYVTARQYVVHTDKDGNTVVLPAGSRLPATAPLVKAHPEQFKPETRSRT
jgi:HK97 family phage major capsid protein